MRFRMCWKGGANSSSPSAHPYKKPKTKMPEEVSNTESQEQSQHSHHHHHHSHHHSSGSSRRHHKHLDDSEIFKNNNLNAKKRRKLFKNILFTVMSVLAVLITLYVIYIYMVDWYMLDAKPHGSLAIRFGRQSKCACPSSIKHATSGFYIPGCCIFFQSLPSFIALKR